MSKTKPKVAVIQFPGSNCEGESLRALDRAGLDGRLIRWTDSPQQTSAHAAYLLPGGFSYQDRIRAGAVAARLRVMDVVCRRAAEGAPVLGLCNGAQILVESGLVGDSTGEPRPPDDRAVPLVLAPNRITGRDGYYTRWIFLAPGAAASRCLFTRDLREALPMPMAHGEGRFASEDRDARRELPADVALRYANSSGEGARGFPENPNGSLFDAAGVCNAAGNVLALMPHPERAQTLSQVPFWMDGAWGERRRAAGSFDLLESDGPGMALFYALARTLTS